MIKFLYKKILKPILFKTDPEFIHNQFVNLGELLGRFYNGRLLIKLLYGYRGPDVSKVVDGNRFKTPVLLSAGFDYNGRLSQILPAMGFGGEEVGSVTARVCAGNKKPRLRRLIKNQSIVVYKGLRNDGVDKIIKRLKNRKKDLVLGISIAMTNDAVCANTEEGINDYYTSLKKLVENRIGDFYTINISCPNAFGGENFAEKNRLDMLLSKLKTVEHQKPMYVKMPINLEWPEFKGLVDVIMKHKFNGVVIGNLNKNYDELEFRDEAPKKYRGGLSGKPTFKRSTELVRRTREEYGEDITIMGVGGILTPEDAIAKFKAGADLVQLISGMILNGPHLINEISHAYAKHINAK